MKHAQGWAVLLALGIVLMILGARGRLGSALGALVAPSGMEDVSDG